MTTGQIGQVTTIDGCGRRHRSISGGVKRCRGGWLSALAVCSALSLSMPGTSLAGVSGLHLGADFEDEPVDAPIGTGGASLGQPVMVEGVLSAMVRDAPMASRSLELGWAGAPTMASFVRFGLLDGEEVMDGQLVIEMTLYPHVGSSYRVSLREAAGAASRFGGLLLQSSGTLRIEDATGLETVATDIAPGESFHVRWVYDLDARRYDFSLDGDLVVRDRPHGVPENGRGIGWVSIGLDWNTPPDTRLSLDDLLVYRLLDDVIFASDFESPESQVMSTGRDRR